MAGGSPPVVKQEATGTLTGSAARPCFWLSPTAGNAPRQGARPKPLTRITSFRNASAVLTPSPTSSHSACRTHDPRRLAKASWFVRRVGGPDGRLKPNAKPDKAKAVEQGVFAQWQPTYEALGIATFPVREKTPCVSNYLKMGQPASRKLLRRFGEADGLGFACGKRSRITVLDIDAPDENLLADALAEFGNTPFVVRSASGNYQAWYRHNGEKRQIRPFPGRAIDVLGGGYVVAPPSKSAKGAYGIIAGKLEDLGSLPTLSQPEIIYSPAPFHIGEQHAEQVAASSLSDGATLSCGNRNATLWRWCMSRRRTVGTGTSCWPLPCEPIVSGFDRRCSRQRSAGWSTRCG